jgi:hypothetical protein
MRRRIFVLTGYFVKSFFFSIAGALLLIGSLVYWAVLFPPGQGTPDIENYVILIGALGGAVSFLVAISIASRANRLENYPLLTRLSSRVEYLTAVFLASLLVAVLLQLLVAALALIRGPELTGKWMLMILPIWLAIDLLGIVIALHASDLVTSGWSRVVIFGLLAILLILNSVSRSQDSWAADRLIDLSSVFYRLNLEPLAQLADTVSASLRGSTFDVVANAASFVFWPFRAMTDAVFQGGFTPAQALAPLVLILYGTILYLIAANLFATKDLEFTE